MTTAAIATDHRLTDDEMASFVIRGYHVVQPDLRAGIDQEIYDALEALPSNPGDAVLEEVPQLNEVWDSPEVVGTSDQPARTRLRDVPSSPLPPERARNAEPADPPRQPDGPQHRRRPNSTARPRRSRARDVLPARRRAQYGTHLRASRYPRPASLARTHGLARQLPRSIHRYRTQPAAW